MALQTSTCSEVRSPGRQDGGRRRREVSRGGQLRLRRKTISDQDGDLKLRWRRRGIRSEPRQPGRRGGPPGSWHRTEGGGCSKSVGRTVAAPAASRPAGARPPVSLIRGGRYLGGSTVEGGRAHGPYGHESQGLGDASSMIACPGALGGGQRMNDNVWGLRGGHGTCQGPVACAFELRH